MPIDRMVGMILYGFAALIFLVLFLLVDPRGVLKALLHVIAFLAPPVILGILCGGMSVFAFLVNELWFVPLLWCIREVIRYRRIEAHGQRAEGAFVGWAPKRSAPRFAFTDADGSTHTESAGSLRNYTAGQSVTVLYDAGKPERCYVEHDSLVNYITLSCVWAAAGAGVLSLTLWVLLSSV